MMGFETSSFLYYYSVYYTAVYPPSIGKVIPVMKEASSLAKNNTVLATSIGSPRRPIGCRLTRLSTTSFDRESIRGVRIYPGAIATARIPSLLTSEAICWVNSFTPPLEAAYGAKPGLATKLWMDPELTITPPEPCCLNCLRIAVAEINALEVDVDDFLPVVGFQIFQCGFDIDTRIGKHHVQTSKFIHRLLYQVSNILFQGHIGFHEDGIITFLIQSFGEFCGLVRNIGKHYIQTFFYKFNSRSFT